MLGTFSSHMSPQSPWTCSFFFRDGIKFGRGTSAYYNTEQRNRIAMRVTGDLNFQLGLAIQVTLFGSHWTLAPCTCTTEPDKRTLNEEEEEQDVSYHQGYSSSLTA